MNVAKKKFKMLIWRRPADERLKEVGMWFGAYFEDRMEGYAMALLTRIVKMNCTETVLRSKRQN